MQLASSLNDSLVAHLKISTKRDVEDAQELIVARCICSAMKFNSNRRIRQNNFSAISKLVITNLMSCFFQSFAS